MKTWLIFLIGIECGTILFSVLGISICYQCKYKEKAMRYKEYINSIYGKCGGK